MTAMVEYPKVFVVDDDIAICESISALLRSTGINVHTFTNGKEFLAAAAGDVPCCVILDVRLQGENGLDIPALMTRNGIYSPVVFMTGHADVQMSVTAMKTGAVDFIVKPFRDQQLLDVVIRSIDDGVERRKHVKKITNLRSRYSELSVRERQVMTHVVNGLLNKQIADVLCLSEITVKVHRRHVMEKMQAPTFADLVKMEVMLAEFLG